MSSSKKSDSKPFLPKINDKSSFSNYSGLVQIAQETPQKGSAESRKAKALDEQLEDASYAFKEAAAMQQKLQN